MNGIEISQWNGNIVISKRQRRIVFIGEAGNTAKQTIHAIKICLALNGDFELIVGMESKRYSAVIINAGVEHIIKCNGAKIFLLYLLPEIQVSREIRWEWLNNDEDNSRTGVYDIPKDLINESMPFLSQMGQDYSKWNCKKVFQECNNVVRSLGKIRRREISISYEIAEKINGSVKKTINYIYTEIKAQIINPAGFDINQFETSVICIKINLPPNKARWLENEFKKETGTTIGHFFRDIQMLAALNLYAIREKERKAIEKELMEKLENQMLIDKERNEIGRELEKIQRITYLMTVAIALGFGELDTFSQRIKSRLGISLFDLRGQSKFFSCEEKNDG